MIIDIHGHVTAPPELEQWKKKLLDGGKDPAPTFSDDQIDAALNRPWFGGGSHLARLEAAKTDVQFVSARPASLVHADGNMYANEAFCAAVNDTIYRQTQLHPDTFKGIANLPQQQGVSPKNCIPEMERCINELGFVGILLNPDPEGGRGERSPGLRDPYWYPIYEKLCEMDVPGIVHSSKSCLERENTGIHFIVEETIAVGSLLVGLGEDGHNPIMPTHPKVFDDFPTLKLIVVHGGGAIPFQIGRYIAGSLGHGQQKHGEPFEESIKRLYYDTAVYTKDALELLIKTMGSDRLMFGTENPGSGSGFNPKTGREMDDIAPLINSIEWLTEEDKSRIFETNAKAVFKV
jgi:4-oxalmesaconate hydratase